MGILLFAVLLWNQALTGNAVVTQEGIQQKEQQIRDAQKEREEINRTLSDIKAIKAELDAVKNNLQLYVAELDAKVTEMQEKIDGLNEDIALKEQEIADTQEELRLARLEQQAQYEAMKVRVRLMYMRGDTTLGEALLGEDSYADALNKVTYIQALSDYDRRKLEEYQQQCILVKTTMEALEEEELTLQEAMAAVEEEKAGMQTLLDSKTAELTAIYGDIHNQEQTIAAYQADIAQRNSEIAALEALVAKEKKELEEQNRPKYTGGVFTWPCPGYSYISSDYGYRVHPIFGNTRLHNGVDMAASTGTPILAAADGTVVGAAYSSSMGNYVMIDHGGGLFTIYMHASALYVSSGQNVTAGTKIAAVGSTGNSTGPHLHFSVRINGEYTSPWNYLGR